MDAAGVTATVTSNLSGTPSDGGKEERGVSGIRPLQESGGKESGRGRGRGGRGGGGPSTKAQDKPEEISGSSNRKSGHTRGRRSKAAKSDSSDGMEEAHKAVPKILLRKAEPSST